MPDIEPVTEGSAASAAAVVVAVTFAIYALTLSRSVGWHDSAELALAAAKLGASHAPGSPLHSVLGYLFSSFFQHPFMATNWLSAIAASLSSGLMAGALVAATGRPYSAVLTALVFALSFQVWADAVATEVYTLGMLCLGVTIWLAWRWSLRRQYNVLLLTLVAFAAALAAYFPNILLIPAFAWLVLARSPKRTRDLATLAAVTALAIAGVAFANFLLARNMPPYAEVVPDSLRNIFLYMTGSQHDPLQAPDMAEIANRVLSHVWIMSRSVLFLILPLALLGAIIHWRRDLAFAVFLQLVFWIYVGYYTLFGPGDFFLMVLPAYFVLCIWAGLGAAGLPHLYSRAPQWLAPALLVVTVTGLLLIQAQGRWQEARWLGPENFVRETFESLPPDSYAIVGWREFTPLVYAQGVDGLRTDAKVLLPVRSSRVYSFGEVESYQDVIRAVTCAEPVFTLTPTLELPTGFELVPTDEMPGWNRISRAGGFDSACAGEPRSSGLLVK